MAPRLTDRIDWPTLIVALTLLTVVTLFGAYLTHRQQIRDHRDEIERQGVCAVLTQIPADRRTRAIRTALSDFHC